MLVSGKKHDGCNYYEIISKQYFRRVKAHNMNSLNAALYIHTVILKKKKTSSEKIELLEYNV